MSDAYRFDFEDWREVERVVGGKLPSIRKYGRDIMTDFLKAVYEAGVDAGEITGYKSALMENGIDDTDDIRDEGYQAGYDDGFDEGREAGYESGFEEGEERGYENGKDDGWNEGHESGVEEGRQDGYDGGYDEGLEAGHDDGYGKGFEDGVESVED